MHDADRRTFGEKSLEAYAADQARLSMRVRGHRRYLGRAVS